MKKIILLSILTLFTATIFAEPVNLAEFIGGVNSSAIWKPSTQTLQSIQQQCAKSSANYLECFNASMKFSGASPQALAFNKYTRGWITKYQKYGNVYLVYAQVLAADYSDAIYFINTQGKIINIDDQDLLQTLAYEKNAQYSLLNNKYPELFLSMSNHEFVKVVNLSNDTQRFIFQYPLVNGCRACSVIGYASIAWDFDKTGSLIKLILLNVSANNNQ